MKYITISGTTSEILLFFWTACIMHASVIVISTKYPADRGYFELPLLPVPLLTPILYLAAVNTGTPSVRDVHFNNAMSFTLTCFTQPNSLSHSFVHTCLSPVSHLNDHCSIRCCGWGLGLKITVRQQNQGVG